MEINFTSRRIIKPSLPTSNECQPYKLCLFDVFQLNTYFPIILFYRKSNDMQKFLDISAQLQKSLSETLTIFYPVAGRRSDSSSVNCNDEGAIYTEASINITMEEFLKPPKLELLNKLLPCEPNKVHPYQQVLPHLLVQVNIFKCGGIAIGLCNLHTILDARSCSVFLKTWSAIFKGSRNEISFPDFSSASSLLPPRHIFSVRSGVLNMNNGSDTTRRFLFDAKSIGGLKSMLENDGIYMKKPTRYEIVSSFICKHMIVACMKELCERARPVVVLHIVDMRKRMGEPFSQNSIGNLLWPAVVLYENVDKNTDIRDFVMILQQGIGKLTKELFLKLQNDHGFLWSDECADLMLEGVAAKNPISFVFTSWANMGFNEMNFGWGKPIWLAPRGGTTETIPNTIVLMETNEGIEAWVTMAEKHISNLENDMNFLRLTLLNPNVSKI